MKLAVVLLICMLSFSGSAQTDENHPPRFVIQPAIGYSYRLTDGKSSYPVDFLSELGRHSINHHFFAGSIFLSQSFGINLKATLNVKQYKNEYQSKGEQFSSFIRDYHSPLHYTEYDIQRMKFYLGESAFISLGVAYRIIKNKWTCQFGLNLGGIKMKTAGITYYLKEHGSNDYQSVLLKTDMDDRMMLSIEPSFLLSYKPIKRLGIFINCSYLFSPSKIRQIEERTDLYTDFRQTFEHSAKNKYHMIAVNLGLSVELGKITK